VYISAASKKLTPALKASSRRRKDSGKVFCSPKVMVPKQSLETARLGARLKRGTDIVSRDQWAGQWDKDIREDSWRETKTKIDWRCRGSNPVPLACKASALPFELHPQFIDNQRFYALSLLARLVYIQIYIYILINKYM
jgi:hypothetical protein